MPKLERKSIDQMSKEEIEKILEEGLDGPNEEIVIKLLFGSGVTITEVTKTDDEKASKSSI